MAAHTPTFVPVFSGEKDTVSCSVPAHFLTFKLDAVTVPYHDTCSVNLVGVDLVEGGFDAVDEAVEP